MNRRGFILTAFALLCAAQLAVPAWMIARRELTLRHGERFRFRTQPVDPVDAFRGRYVRLSLEPNVLETPDFGEWRSNERAYAVLATGEDGFAKVVRLERRLPAGEPAMPARIDWSHGNKREVRFRWMLDRYYMEESKAPAAEEAYREHSRREKRACHVAVRVRAGNAVLEELFIDDKPIREHLAGPSAN